MLQRNTKWGLDGTKIKLIALLIMTLDHIGAYGSNIPFARENYLLIRQFGRIAAPLFLFMLTESLRHTRSRRRFLRRLYLASVITGLLNALLGEWMGYSFGNIFQTFLWISAAAFAIDFSREGKGRGPLLWLLLALLLSYGLDALVCAPFFDFRGAALVRELLRAFINSPTQVEYSIGMILLGLLWYYMPGKGLCALSLVLLSIPAFFGFSSYPEWTMFSGIQYTMALAAPLILLYNGEKGRGMGKLFYIYYPLHVYIIALINRVVF